MARKRVIIFSCFYTPYVSGAERFVIEVVERLAGRYECTVITARNSRSNVKEEVAQAKNNATYRIIRVGIGSWYLDRFLYVLWAPLVARKLKPDIIHAVMESYAGGALAVYKWLTRTPRPLRILTLQSGEQYSLRKRLKVPSFLRAQIHRSPDKLTAISTFLKDKASGWGAQDITVIPNGVDVDHIANIAVGTTEHVSHRIVCVARLSWEKGIEYLIDALIEVRNNFNDAHLVLVGSGSLENKLKDVVVKHGLEESVLFKGTQKNDVAISEIARAEVFACPSLFEGLGIVFIEAQAVGTPVIGTRIGGIPDVIEDGVTGLLVPPKDSHALAQAIEKIFVDKEKAKEMVLNAKGRLGRFEWDRVAEQVAQIYESGK